MSDGDITPEWPQAGVGSRTQTQPRTENPIKRFFASAGFLLDASRKRPAGRRVLSAIVAVLVIAGLGMIAYPAVTNIWAGRTQDKLHKDFQALGPGGYTSRSFKDGQGVTRLIIKKLHVDVIVVYGWSGNALRAGAGLKPDPPGNALPGDPVGNVAIAGHRTGFGEPFRHLEKLTAGDKVELDTPIGNFLYEVVPAFDGHPNPWVTTPYDFTVIGPTPYGALTLVTCDPPHTSKKRMIVRARLVGRA
ncbi:MAG: class E sortase [Actinomycetota bacterium]